MLETRETRIDTLAIMNSLPGNYLVLLPDAPAYTVVGATESFLRNTHTTREGLIGKGVFDVYYLHPKVSVLQNSNPLQVSLDKVVEEKREDRMSHHHYDLLNPETGRLELRVWQPLNKPVLDDKGNIAYIIHCIEDITKNISLEASEQTAQKALLESEFNLRSIILNAPVAMCILRGPGYVIEIANHRMAELWDRSLQDVINKPIFEAFPEARNQGIEELLHHVYTTGITYQENERFAMLKRNDQADQLYVNLVYQALKESDGTISGIMCVALEVTEQVVSKKSIAKKEEELQMALAIANLGTFHVDIPSNSATYSERVMKWFGFDKQQLSMDVVFGKILPEDQAGVVQAIENTMAYGNDHKHDLTYRIKDPGTGTRFLRSFGQTYFNDHKQPTTIIGIIQDVTTQMLHQQALEENEAELHRRVRQRTADLENQTALSDSILDASLGGVVAMDGVRNEQGEVIDFTLVKINRQFVNILGLDEGILGKRYLEVFPLSSKNGMFEMYRDVLVTGKSLRQEVYTENRGLNAWFDISVAKRGDNGIAVIFANVSSQRQASILMEQQKNLLDNILKYSPSGIMVSEMIRDQHGQVTDTRTIMANETAEKFIGLPLKNLLNQTTRDIDPGMLKSSLFTQSLLTLDSGEPFITQYYFEPTGRWLELSVSRLDANRLINVFTDVTSIKETQLQLEKNLEELKRSNLNLEEFAYAASHDMKEPIRKIHFFSDRLKEKLSDKMEEEDRGLFLRMENASKRMAALIDDLLLYSHVSREVALEEEVNLNQKIAMVLQDLELEIQERKAVIIVDQMPTIRGHRRQLQQLFQNLVSNALKYSKPGEVPQIHIRSQKIQGVNVPIQLTNDEIEKEFHFIEVQDQGIGFEQSDAERIFNVFTRLHGNSEFKGTGVGLSIARKVVDNHGGHIWAEGKAGEGSVFKILLPADL